MFGRNTGKPLKGPTMGAHTIHVWHEHVGHHLEMNHFGRQTELPKIKVCVRINIQKHTLYNQKY